MSGHPFSQRKSERDPKKTDAYSPPEDALRCLKTKGKAKVFVAKSAQETAALEHFARADALVQFMSEHTDVVTLVGKRVNILGCRKIAVKDLAKFHDLLEDMVLENRDGVWGETSAYCTWVVYSTLRRLGFKEELLLRCPNPPEQSMMWFRVYTFSYRNSKVANRFPPLNRADVMELACVHTYNEMLDAEGQIVEGEEDDEQAEEDEGEQAEEDEGEQAQPAVPLFRSNAHGKEAM